MTILQIMPLAQALRLAAKKEKQHDFAYSTRLYQDILNTFPKNTAARKGLKSVQNQPGFEAPIPQEPPEDQIQHITRLYNTGALIAASEAGASLLREFPESGLLHNLMGAIAMGLGAFAQAESSFERIKLIDPYSAENHYNLGHARSKQDKTKLAIKSFQLAILLKPEFSNAHNSLGIALKSAGQIEPALHSYRKALEIDPNFAEAFYNMGNLFKEHGNLEDAKRCFKSSLEMEPGLCEAHFNLGVIYKAQGSLDLAINSYLQAVEVNPMLHEGYNNLGLCLQDQGDLSAALKSFQAAIKLQPDYTDAIYNMGNVLKDMDDFASAVSCFQDLIKIDPNYNRAQHLLNALTGQTTQTPPQEYVESLFEEYAPHFEQDLIHNLHYTAPKRLVDALLHLSAQKNLGSVLDLGCGTGLIGNEVKRFAFYIEGVDLSKSMVEQAERKNIYDRLIISDINAYLAKTSLDFDCIMAADVFIYLGDLSETFQLIKAGKKRPGKLAFSTEHLETGSFKLERSGRYAHSKHYIISLCSQFGFELSHFSTIKLRKDKAAFLTGGLYILDF